MDTGTKGRVTLSSKLWIGGLVILLALLASVILSRLNSVDSGMTVTFHNSSDLMIESIQLDFGSADTQSKIQAFRIPAGEERILLLNHQPGMGFNVQVNYRGGNKQAFCALRGDDQRRPVIYLQP
ncbi:hypothetical protein [uncultured Amphritea sp.]|uniref:hypothetical protein n=1 Tax=uncultured Amphritea sp. TaxID=981605 RepID=UPI002634FEB3|nr:hypothetical protein [uncultured Amphritea sp.]